MIEALGPWVFLGSVLFFWPDHGVKPHQHVQFHMATNLTVVLIFHINYLSHFTMITIQYTPHPFSGAEPHLQLSGSIFLVN